jgi:hypothetical protein
MNDDNEKDLLFALVSGALFAYALYKRPAVRQALLDLVAPAAKPLPPVTLEAVQRRLEQLSRAP